jgi:hypothetical protein
MLRLPLNLQVSGHASLHPHISSLNKFIPSVRLSPKDQQRKIKAIPNSIALFLLKNYLVF